ncbi:MAG: GNAT family N-acetyltransferase [Candidatus Nanoarchaeia archaeon]
MKIRLFIPKDAEEVTALRHNSLIAHEQGVPDIKETPEEIIDLAKKGVMIIATDNEKIIATIAVFDELIGDLYVSPSHQGRGIARKLFRLAESIILQRGYTFAKGISRMSSISFNKKMGFKMLENKKENGQVVGVHCVKDLISNKCIVTDKSIPLTIPFLLAEQTKSTLVLGEPVNLPWDTNVTNEGSHFDIIIANSYTDLKQIMKLPKKLVKGGVGCMIIPFSDVGPGLKMCMNSFDEELKQLIRPYSTPWDKLKILIQELFEFTCFLELHTNNKFHYIYFSNEPMFQKRVFPPLQNILETLMLA